MNPYLRSPNEANALASVPPPMHSGTTRASGSCSTIAWAIASNHGESTGDSHGSDGAAISISTSGPTSSSSVALVCSNVPGGQRTSISALASDGMTFTFVPAESIVTVADGRTVQGNGPAVSGPTAPQNAANDASSSTSTS